MQGAFRLEVELKVLLNAFRNENRAKVKRPSLCRCSGQVLLPPSDEGASQVSTGKGGPTLIR